MAKRSVRRRTDRRGFEISATMLVVLILSVTIFGGGLYMIKQYFSFAQKVQGQVDADTQRQINDKLREGVEPVIIPINKKRASGGDTVTFGLGVLNTLGRNNTFGMDVRFAGAYAMGTEAPLTGDNPPDAGYINSNWIMTSYPAFHLNPNERKVIPISVKIDNRMNAQGTTQEGAIYAFNVCIYKKPNENFNCGFTSSTTGTDTTMNPDQLRTIIHGGKIRQIIVQVD